MATQGPGETTDDREAWLRGMATKFLTPRPTERAPRDDQLASEGTPLTLCSGLAATAWGEGPPVLLAHGWNSRGTHWGAFLRPLVEAGLRPVAVEAPAHGESPGVTVNVRQYGLALAAAGRELGPLAGVVGHSFGAAASAVALARGLDARRAALIAGPSSLVGVVERWCARHAMTAAEVARFLEVVAEDVGEPLESLEIARLAPGLEPPALIVHDRGDEEIPLEEAEAIAAAWPGATLLVTERYGHRRILIAKEVVRRVVDFLRPDA